MTMGTLILVILGGLLLLGISYELVMSLMLRQRYSKPRGERVDIGGYQLHMVKLGEAEADKPTIILESGIGGNSLDWQRVQDDIAKFAQVISYDRAGYGWSDNPRQPRTPDNIVTELNQLLNNANVAPPYVLVAHSFGALYTLQFVEKYPEKVAGLVLVDSAHPEMLKPINIQPELRRLRINTVLKRFGILRLLIKGALYQADYLDDDAKAQYVAMTLQDSPNTFREAKPLFASKFDTPELQIPISVISREPKEADEKWHDYQQKLVTMSDQAIHLISEKRNHYVMLATPELVVDAIRQHIQNEEIESES